MQNKEKERKIGSRKMEKERRAREGPGTTKKKLLSIQEHVIHKEEKMFEEKANS